MTEYKREEARDKAGEGTAGNVSSVPSAAEIYLSFFSLLGICGVFFFFFFFSNN